MYRVNKGANPIIRVNPIFRVKCAICIYVYLYLSMHVYIYIYSQTYMHSQRCIHTHLRHLIV